MGPEAQRLLARIQLSGAHDLGRRARSSLGPAGVMAAPPPRSVPGCFGTLPSTPEKRDLWHKCGVRAMRMSSVALYPWSVYVRRTGRAGRTARSSAGVAPQVLACSQQTAVRLLSHVGREPGGQGFSASFTRSKLTLSCANTFRDTHTPRAHAHPQRAGRRVRLHPASSAARPAFAGSRLRPSSPRRG